MPELPEVDTIMQEIRSVFTETCINNVSIYRPDLRRPFPPQLKERLMGRRITAVRRRAKYILIMLDHGWTLLIHLGMSGRIYITTPGEHYERRKHEHFVITVEGQKRLSLVDPRRFGLVDIFPSSEEHKHPFLGHLGCEPLGEKALTGKKLQKIFQASRMPIKNALLDQRKIAGLGNIYVCEALYRAAIAPQMPAGALCLTDYTALATVIPTILHEALAAGGSSLRDYVTTRGERGGFQELHRVYGRAGEVCAFCHEKGTTAYIAKITQAGRSTFFCPHHQKNKDE